MSEGALSSPVELPAAPLPALISVDAMPVIKTAAPPAPATSPAPHTRTTPATSLLAGLVRTARPRQWVKNLLVFAAPGAAGVLTEAEALSRSVVAFGVFCLAASGSYFFNDTVDREHDRRHPVKRHRPVAAGDVAGGVAVATGAFLSGTALLLGLTLLGWKVALAVALYLAVNAAYNLRLRSEPVLDLAAVASGFVIRAVAGGLATGVALSDWFLVVISFASLFVVAGKRQAATPSATASATASAIASAIASATASGTPSAPCRVAYPASFLRYVRLLASGVALTSYCLWAFERADAGAGGVWFELTIVPFALAMLRYALLVEQDGEAAPEDLLLGDGTVRVLVGLWVALFTIGVYGA